MQQPQSNEDQQLRDRVKGALAELISSQLPGLPMGLQATVKMGMPLLLAGVESSSPDELRSYLLQAKATIDAMLSGAPLPTELEGELAPPALPEPTGEWYDPVARVLTVRQPTPEDALALVDAIGLVDPDSPEAKLLEQSANRILESLTVDADGTEHTVHYEETPPAPESPAADVVCEVVETRPPLAEYIETPPPPPAPPQEFIQEVIEEGHPLWSPPAEPERSEADRFEPESPTPAETPLNGPARASLA